MKHLRIALVGLGILGLTNVGSASGPFGRGLPAPSAAVSGNYGYYPTCWRPFPEECLRQCPPNGVGPTILNSPSAPGTTILVPSQAAVEPIPTPKDPTTPIPRSQKPDQETVPGAAIKATGIRQTGKPIVRLSGELLTPTEKKPVAAKLGLPVTKPTN
jgi:hypothetical protein